MGKMLCGCQYNNNIQMEKCKMESDLSSKASNINETCSWGIPANTSQLTNKEQRTKAGTKWNKIEGLEKISILNKVNRISKHWKAFKKRRRVTFNHNLTKKYSV